MKIARPKAFLEALSSFSANTEKSKNYLNDKRLTQSEKAILRCYFLLRNNELEEVLLELSKLSSDLDPIVKSQRELLLGLTYNNQSKLAQALEHIQHALVLMKGQELPYFEFIAKVNLFTVHFNLKDLSQMKKSLDQLKRLSLNRDIDRMRVLQCSFNYHVFAENFDEARDVLEEIEVLSHNMPESDRIGHLVFKFEFYVKLEDFEKCKQIMAEMKSHRKFNLTQNFNFMKLLLEHHLNHGPIYLDEKVFSNFPLLFHQLKVIQLLEEGNREKAMEHWQKLQVLHPELYGQDFKFLGGKCLFSLCLEKYLKARAPLLIEDSSGKIIDTLAAIFKESTAPIMKEALFEKLWGRKPVDKADLKKLTRSITRLRVKYGIEVKSRKGCYYLERHFSHKAS